MPGDFGHMKKKLLVIDDEPSVLDMIQGHFSLRGFDVLTADDGGSGIAVCRDSLPDVIILDLKMKHMDGDEALPELRRIVPDARIYVVSAYQDEITEKRVAGLGVDAYFEKPVSIIDLQHTIQQALAS